MEQRISIVTLGVSDVTRSRRFYEELGWRGQEVEETVFFQAGGLAVVLWAREKLAADAGLDDARAPGFGGMALAQNVRSREEVDEASERLADPATYADPALVRDLVARHNAALDGIGELEATELRLAAELDAASATPARA